jgi:actin-like ATPase involved in cell morphogenesis
MERRQSVFGIDFGTTNTRVAHYDGKTMHMVPIYDDRGISYSIPTQVNYEDGRPAAFGYSALQRRQGALPPQSIKWLLDRDDPVEVDGRPMDPVQMAADYFTHLRQAVGEAIPSTPMDRAAISIPVEFPPRARINLLRACERAGIEVTHFFFEPVAALYCDLFVHPTSGVAAVFDWGGGSLDIATIKIQDGIAWTRQVEGWHRGGEYFDEMICGQAVEAFLRSHPELPHTADDILFTVRGRRLRQLAEQVKIDVSRGRHGSMEYVALVGGADLDYTLTPGEFEEWIDQSVGEAVNRLKRAIRETGISPGLLARLFLSGGTCNIPAIQERLARQIAGERIVTSIAIPPPLRSDPGGMDDIGNATALGAALLAVHGTRPVFAGDVGVRLAHAWDDHDAFFPIFRAGERVTFAPRKERFFVSDAASGVARLLVCDRPDTAAKPQGRLLRIIPVPIDPNESWLEVEFSVDRHLVLRVVASGSIARAEHAESVWIPDLNLGFEMPARVAARQETEVVR